jgi:mRNA interferase MazF
MVTVRPVPLPVQRGTIYWADIGSGRKPWLIVSNNGRNRHLGDFLAVRITTSEKPALPSIVELAPGDPLVGRVLCDEIALLFETDLEGFGGGVTFETMMRVDAGLRSALALR